MSSSQSDFVDTLLSAQQSLTAVDLFGQRIQETTPALHGQYYTDLIPLASPKDDQQYAFEVDLDKCTGCKSCVAACHALNGLDDSEAWRKVGSMVGGTPELPVLQHITTACHHCLEPACSDGCPVNAYEKLPETGIVIHLDDQCIGCQYCLFKCPYDVPVYNHDKGIVRKCDMCHDRLAANEAPACVQACPQHAIRIVISDEADTIANAQANQFLPTAPAPDYTLPTTHYKTTKPLPRNLLASDFYVGRPQHAPGPLATI
nr:4Fe-4S dicluster domain-containing protein [Planctomycetota bacterium]